MTMPKMILFDYGGTLLYEPDFDPRRGNEALFRLIKDNPNNITLDEYSEKLQSLFEEIRELRSDLIEIHEYHFLRYLLEYFNITLTVPIEEAEQAVFEAVAHAELTPDSDIILDHLSRNNIRTGVISNLCWSGKALSARLDKHFPKHHFDFIMTSSEYIFRKPDKHIFELAVRKSGLNASEIWYCGNNIRADIIGAHEAGLFPVFYNNTNLNHSERLDNDVSNINFPCLTVSSWKEFIEVLRVNT